jgi:hypothetical protein
MKPYLEKIHHKKRADGVVQGIGPKFKLQYHTHTHTQRMKLGFHSYYLQKLIPNGSKTSLTVIEKL